MHYYSEWMKPLASIRTSKVCPYRFNFCALWKLTGGAYIKRFGIDIGGVKKNKRGVYIFC